MIGRPNRFNARLQTLVLLAAAIAVRFSTIAEVRAIEHLQNEQAIVAALRHMNSDASIRAGHGQYMELLRYGSGEQQPGADLNAAWFARNVQICARLLHTLIAGDRAVVVFGAGHVGCCSAV